MPSISLSSKIILPDVFFSIPTIILAKVDFPRPDSPTIPIHSPLFNLIFIFLRAFNSLFLSTVNDFEMFSIINKSSLVSSP